MIFDPFEDEEWIRRTYQSLAEGSGMEIPPEELKQQLRGFFLRVQEELAIEGVWWEIGELVSYCLQPVVLAAVKALARVRGNASWREFVDTITSLERGRFQP